MDPIGNIRPCNHSSTILGNIREKSIQSMIDGAEMDRFVDACPDFCKGCGMEKICIGGCKAAGEACFGNLNELEPFVREFKAKVKKVRET
ncbi:SPASM domain-containing protein [bacterium]|nr:SPASM domain-containing protein [bacterium]